MEHVDQLRYEILTHLDEVRKKAINVNMQRQTMQQIQIAMKKKGYEREAVASETVYLKDAGYVKSKSITVPAISFGAGTGYRSTNHIKPKSSKHDEYYISDKGRDRLTGPSAEFHRQSGGYINIGTIYNGGAIAIGGNNSQAIVYKDHVELYNALGALKEGVLSARDLEDSKKAEITADIETIQSQVSKPEPNRSIVKLAWGGLGVLGNIQTAYSLYKIVSTLIRPFIG